MLDLYIFSFVYLGMIDGSWGYIIWPLPRLKTFWVNDLRTTS